MEIGHFLQILTSILFMSGPLPKRVQLRPMLAVHTPPPQLRAENSDLPTQHG